ncbi:MAG TPA: hypothetical protein VJZ91_09015 [Blastocatellia bacterium]|nr:hypothetical protein [Blastocatellia bacterium]
MIDCELNILGFGVKIEPGPDHSDPPVIYNIDALERADEDTRTELSEVGGMRHQSAARFVFNQREAVALVVSQDKNVTGMAWQQNYRGRGEEALCLYRNLELALF